MVRKKWSQKENQVKLVIKPWGNGRIGGVKSVGELWLNYDRNENVGDKDKRYVFKKLYIKKGTKTSFQYHVNKLETNHLIKGKAEAWQENEKGVIEKSLFEAGDTWTIPCGRKHRLIALSDMVMLEASTPEVDDVVRIADDTGRGDGRIESEHKDSAKKKKR
jgi:mannose-6-phosphate isomerase-like protein (cupin superfamily)